ncbi:ABC transporter permease [Spiroplasma sp. BIUS-1]|uniref:ABC transporter permease n=1 Tax=Spiroplasma sp. BIUS-1 TaxID=216964 RepID=UPI001397A0B9|nr:ABC transporter permease [Spiroplasma sp. BIUS-1]QHX36980.1 ABC transporter permease [Spiroplasma sp. BIUS-1]
MKGIRLLLKNAFRSAGKNKSQIIGLSLLVMLVSLVISVLSATTTRVVGAYEKLNTQSNLRDIVVDVDLNNEIKENESWKDLSDYTIEGSLTQEKLFYQQYILNSMSLKYGFDVSFTESRLISGLKGKNGDIKVKTISKIDSNGHEKGVDKLVISKGRSFTPINGNVAPKEVVIGESYAKENNIKIGDIVRVNADKFGKDLLVKNTTGDSPEILALNEAIKNNNAQTVLNMAAYSNQVWFEVVGIGTSSDFTTPILDQTTVMPNVKNEVLMYMDPSWMGYQSKPTTFKKQNPEEKYTRNLSTYAVQSAKVVVSSETDREAYFSIKSNNEFNSTYLEKLNNEYKEYLDIKIDKQYFYDSNDSEYKFSERVSTFKTIMTAYNAMATALIIVIISIAGFTTILTTKKQVELQSRQIGCLKSLGYKKREVVNNFVAIPLIVSIIGAFAGYILAIFIETVVVGMFSNYFNVAFSGFRFNIVSFASSIVGLWIALTLLAFGIGYWTIRLSALTLLKGGDDKVINKFAMKIKSLSAKRRFNPRLRVALLTTSLGKLAGVSATMLLSATLITTTVVAPKVMSDNMTATFRGMNYENMVSYTQPIANNPYSFYKTYNPSFKDQEWGKYDKDKEVLIRNSGSGNAVGSDFVGANPAGWAEGLTPYPVMQKPEGYISNIAGDKTDYIINWDKVIKDLLAGDVSPYYYSYDIALNDTFFWTEFSFLDWKNMSSKLLSNLDAASISGIAGSIALSQLQGQWPDYNPLLLSIGNLTKNKKPGSEQLKEYSNIMMNFYAKYINGIQLTYNSLALMNDKENNLNTDKLISSGLLKYPLLSSQFRNGNNNFWYANKDTKTSEFMNLDIKKGDFKVDLNKKGKFISPLDINVNSLKDEQLKTLNTALTLWFGSVFEKRMGMTILQTTYTRASYFVQEQMKQAIENDKNYNIAFNLVPYNEKEDEIGTKLDTTFTSVNGKKESASIFGINSESNLIDLRDSQGNELKNKLFLNNNENVVPIIINKSMYKKINQDIGSNINLDISRDLLFDKEGNEINLKDVDYGHNENGNKDNDFNTMKTQSTYAWYSRGDGYTNHSLAGLNSAKINGKEIAAGAANDATKPTPIYKGYRNGDLVVKNKSEEKQFKIVGIQDGYGQPQGWIANDSANKIMEYDQVKEKNFEKWFSREYPKGNAIYKMDIFSGDNDQKIQGTNLEEFIDEVNQGKRTYEDFISNVNRSKENSSWRKMNQLYENLFPIFNYKYTSDKNNLDITDGFSVSQRFADFSSVGLNGNFEMKEDETGEACKPSQDGGLLKDDSQKCMVIDPDKFNEGYGVGSLSTMLPKEQTRQILGQVTALVNMVMIMFITIAVIVSATIILLTTSLIIYENKQFIATMKTLGYSNPYVVKQILGMYIMPILIMYVVGFLIGWFTFVYIANFLAINTAWVLPVQFTIWLPFAVFGVIAAIYGVTFGIGWSNIQKINPLEALKDKD